MFRRGQILIASMQALLLAMLIIFLPAMAGEQIKVGSSKRYFNIHLPKRLKAGEKPPLVVVLHGALSNPWSIKFDSDINRYSDQQGFIAVYPYGTGYGSHQLLFWNAGACCGPASDRKVDDVAFIGSLIKTIKNQYNVDPDRVYIVGASNGGMMAYRLAVELSDPVAAIASVDGCMFPVDKTPHRPVSIIEFHGTADSVIPYQGGTGRWFIYKVRDVPAAAQTMAYWIKQDHCVTSPVREDNRYSLKETYDGGEGGSAVCLVTSKGGHHMWPGGRGATLSGDKASTKTNATAMMLDFFWKHPRQSCSAGFIQSVQ